MAFSEISDATRTRIEADLAEAAGRGINGGVDAIAATFEDVLTEYLTRDADLRRDFPRGETARIFGTALGEALVRDHGFAWRMLADDYGTDLVVARGVGAPDEKYTAPLVVVDSRFEDDEPGKLTTFVTQFLS
ncbi:DUF3806 domain-containing protein [Corynebacterium sp. UBA2622]|uniref:DUF3806 domain-containing protein n=1 Tax=Corynebacterium sp. UBA2622 TaxID=1946393 RepID=UPI0025BD0BF5|nr:DUF3806 domain-containing protein [Corynebacterium sp. UBA2622]